MIQNDLFYDLIFGYVLGISMAAPPGPVNAVIMNESMKSPFHGTSVGLGAMTADLIFFFIIYYFRLFIPGSVMVFIYFSAAALLIYIAIVTEKSEISKRTERGNYFVGLGMGITNPFQIVWWFSAGIFMINQFTILSGVGFFSGILTWIIIFPLVLKRYLQKYYKYIKIFSVLILIIFSGIILFYAMEIII